MSGGYWLVFISNDGYKNYDFSLIRVKGGGEFCEFLIIINISYMSSIIEQ